MNKYRNDACTKLQGKVIVGWDHGEQNFNVQCDESNTYSLRKVDEPKILVDEMTAVGCRVSATPYSESENESHRPNSRPNRPNSTQEPADYVIPIYSDSTVSAIWEYQEGSEWKKYPNDINVKIEKAYQKKKTGKTIIEMDRTTYITLGNFYLGQYCGSATKQISALMVNTSKVITLVDNLQNTTAFGGDNSKDSSSDMSNNNEVPGVIGNVPCLESGEASGEDNTQCKSENEFCSVDNSIHNHPSNLDDMTVPPSLTHNTVNGNASNMIPYEPISEQSDTKFLKELGSNSDNVKVQHASTSTNKYRIYNSGDENIQDENEIDQENSLYTSNKETSDGLSSDMKKCNEPKLQIKIHKNESGYKSKTRIKQNDNRVCYINKDNIGKTIDYSYFIRNFQREKSIVPNIKPTENMTDAIKVKMKSATSRQDEDIYKKGIFAADQPKTFKEWYQYTEQIKAYASARVKSGAVKLGREHDNMLVLDISERMAEYFQQMKSAALQYVYGIKEIAECGGNENGIGLAVFGRETRLIQEATNDYELIIELIRQLRPDGDASVIAGLLMGYAGVSACKVRRIKDVVVRAHMIVFTNGSSEQCSFSAENKEFASMNDTVPPNIDCVIDEITSTTTKLFYVPIGGDQCNNILEQVVRKKRMEKLYQTMKWIV
ncbi:unnamed protein product [Mytilus coruscus]|uniref:WWE domain-containing protein n=1 Tax=Mytilus coruscus TaxID=42192 RepID=A0A6J8EJZ0_MYTCO|nr:unnamed protein product [Mytilus coruscus]